MNGRTAAILVVILALLAALVVMTAPGSGGAGGGRVVPLVGVPASQIGAIEVRSGEDIVRIDQRKDWNGWLVAGIVDGISSSWPASETTRAAAARVLSNSQLYPGVRSDLISESLVIIEPIDGSIPPTTMRVSRQPMAGKLPVRMMGTSKDWHTINKELGDFLKIESLLAWRDQALLPGLDAGVVSLSIDREGDLLALRRVGANWSVELPVNEPADSAKVQGLIETLIGARSQRFVDAMPTSGIVTLAVESGASGDRRRYTAMIDTNALVADVTLDKVVGEKVTQVARAQVEVSPELVTALDVGARDFVSGRSIALPASEVAALTLGWNERKLARTSEGWASAEDEALALAWLELLTEREADEVSLSAGGTAALGSIEMTGFGDLAMGRVQVRVEDEMVWVARDRVWRGYRVGEDDRQALGIE